MSVCYCLANCASILLIISSSGLIINSCKTYPESCYRLNGKNAIYDLVIATSRIFQKLRRIAVNKWMRCRGSKKPRGIVFILNS